MSWSTVPSSACPVTHRTFASTISNPQDPTPANEFPFWKVLAAGGAAGLAGSFVSCPSEHVSVLLC